MVEGQPTVLVVEPGRRTPIVLRGGDGNSSVRNSVESFSELRIALPGENAQRYVVIQSFY